MKAEIDALREVPSNVIELDPAKRHVILMNYGTPSIYLKSISEKWKAVFGHEPVIIMQRGGQDVFKIFEVDAYEAFALEKSNDVPGTPK